MVAFRALQWRRVQDPRHFYRGYVLHLSYRDTFDIKLPHVGMHCRAMTSTTIPAALGDWIIAQAMAGQPPEQALQPLLDQGWNEQDAIDAVEALLRGASSNMQ